MASIRPSSPRQGLNPPSKLWHVVPLCPLSLIFGQIGGRLSTSRSRRISRACEALANAAKHSEASVVTIALDMRDSNVRLSVHDDGIGEPTPTRAQASWDSLIALRR